MRHLLLIGLVALSYTNGKAVAGGPGAPMSKGSFFLYWGYNQAGYSWSDIHFRGAEYDFTLRHVIARDRPEKFNARTYFSPLSMWVPQYNYRAGWYFHSRWSISVGMDHMKYILVKDQQVLADGTIHDPGGSATYVGDGQREMILSEDVITYEHTDGLNLLSVDVDHYDPLWAGANGRFALHLFEGFHAGPVIPRTDVRLFGEGINNKFHLAGYGIGVQAGAHLTLFRHGFLRFTGKAGWIDMPSVLTRGTEGDRASQHFWFWQGALVAGAQFRIGRRQDPAVPH